LIVAAAAAEEKKPAELLPTNMLNDKERQEIAELRRDYALLQSQLEALRLKLERVSAMACNRVGVLIQDCEISPEGAIAKKKSETERKSQ